MYITVIACMNPCIESLMTSEFLPMIVSILGSFDNSPELSLVGLVCYRQQLYNRDNNCTIKTTTVQYRQQQYNTTKPERNMNNLINTVNNCTKKTINVQYRQQQYNTTKHLWGYLIKVIVIVWLLRVPDQGYSNRSTFEGTWSRLF